MSSYIKDAIVLPTIDCDITKAATNVAIDFSLIHKKWRKYLVTLKDFLKISCFKIQLFEQNLNLITSKGKHLITRHCYRFQYLDTIFKVLR